MSLKHGGAASLAAFIALALGGGTAIGLLTGPDAWFAALEKPGFNPPDWVFAPVWSVLYLMIGIAGWLVWRRAPRSLAMALWGLQLGLNFLWPPVFFSLHQIPLALAIVALMTVLGWGFVLATIHHMPRAALLFVPYCLWLMFATTLNAALYSLNPGV
ncbi:MAG: TspO/MBR family protein [Pseudomonadota bacterium]